MKYFNRIHKQSPITNATERHGTTAALSSTAAA